MYWVLRFLGNLVGRLSPSAVDRVARGLAVFLFDIARVRRTLVLSNIRKAYPNLTANETVRMGRTSVYHFCCTILEIFYSTRNNIIQGIDVDGKHRIDAAVARGQGIYVLCC